MSLSGRLRGMTRSAIELDFDLYRTSVDIPGINHATMSVIDIQSEGVESTLLFVHGYAGCADTWEYQINHFAKSYRVVAPDLRGHGNSDAPYSQYTMPEMVGDLKAVVDTLQLPPQFVVVGHSFGGSICVEFANAFPERVAKLVLIATAGEYPLPRAAAMLFRLPNWVYRPVWRWRPRWNADIHVMKRMFLNNMRRWRGWPLLRNLSCETLVITGARDNFFPRFVFDDIGRMIPNAEVVDIGTAKHRVQLERHTAVNRAIDRFISDDGRKSSWRATGETPLQPRRPWLSSYSAGTPHSVPIPKQPVHRFLESAAKWLPKRAAAISQGETLTYEALNDQSNRLAHALVGMGVGSGDRVCVVLPTCAQFVVAYYAILKAGGVVVVPNPDARGPEVQGAITSTQAKVLVSLVEFLPMIDAIQPAIPGVTIVLAELAKQDIPAERRREILKRGAFLADILSDADAVEHGPEIDVAMDDLAAIVFTSGTTNQPKGVCLTHRNLVANTMQLRHWVPDLQYGKEILLAVLPLCHSYGMTTAMNLPIAVGATIVMLPRFDVGTVLEAIKRHKPTLFPGVPAMYTAINNAPNVRSYGLNTIKACISGAAPLPVEVQEAFEKLTRGRLVEGYGLTEASPSTHANPLYGTRKVGFIGVPLPNTDADIVDLRTGDVLPPGQIGELRVRGPQVMRGYWDEAGDQSSDDESVLRDGWLYTGDLALMDADGYFQLVSRKKDTIFSGAYSVYPRDVEEVLYENSKVLEAAVVGVTVEGDEHGGQRVKAYVVPRPGTRLTEDELIALCQRRLEPHAVPIEIEFRDTLPKSFVGKVLRRLLVDPNDAGNPA